MKPLEKLGWVMFLTGLAVFVTTVLYGFGKWIFRTLVNLFHFYNAHLPTILVLMILVMIAGAVLIRTGGSQDNQGGSA
ncbi:MAG: hypothetical protein AB7F75_09950 [Planctomycetota bacterium]